MAEASKNHQNHRSSGKSNTPPNAEPIKLGDVPALDDQTLDKLFNWLHTIDDVRIAGHQNKLPRWVYVVALLLIFF